MRSLTVIWISWMMEKWKQRKNQKTFFSDIEDFVANTEISAESQELPRVNVHCSLGEQNIRELPLYANIKNVILYHHENADGSGPFGKTWMEVPLFARIIHMCDLLDLVCRTKNFTSETWKRVSTFLARAKGSVVDEACLTKNPVRS